MQKEQDVTVYLKQDLTVAGTLLFNLFESFYVFNLFECLRVHVCAIHMLLEKKALKFPELELDHGVLL